MSTSLFERLSQIESSEHGVLLSQIRNNAEFGRGGSERDPAIVVADKPVPGHHAAEDIGGKVAVNRVSVPQPDTGRNCAATIATAQEET